MFPEAHTWRLTMRRAGFTLIELMIVIAIIAIIAAIAIPNLLDARKAANEANAIAFLRSYHSAQNVYREQDKDGNGTLDYAQSSAQLVAADLLEAPNGTEESGGMTFMTASGYGFVNSADSVATSFTWSMVCSPEEDNDSGSRQFSIDQTGVIRYTWWDNFDEAPTDWPAIGK